MYNAETPLNLRLNDRFGPGIYLHALVEGSGSWCLSRRQLTHCLYALYPTLKPSLINVWKAIAAMPLFPKYFYALPNRYTVNHHLVLLLSLHGIPFQSHYIIPNQSCALPSWKRSGIVLPISICDVIPEMQFRPPLRHHCIVAGVFLTALK